MLYGSIRFDVVGRCITVVTFHTICKLGRPVTIVHKPNDSETAHGTSFSRGKQAGVNGIIVYSLYGSMQFLAVRRRTGAVTFHTICKLGSPVTTVHKVNYSETAHGTSPGRGTQSGVNGILLYRLY